jgi:hypothetical protein
MTDFGHLTRLYLAAAIGSRTASCINGQTANRGTWVRSSKQLTAGRHFEVRGEAFSVVHNPQRNNPGTSIGNTTFGYITGAGANRRIQGAKIVF